MKALRSWPLVMAAGVVLAAAAPSPSPAPSPPATAAATAPAVAPSTPGATAAAAGPSRWMRPTCSEGTRANLSNVSPVIRTDLPQVSPTTTLMAENFPNTILVRKPAAAGPQANYSLRVFLAPKNTRPWGLSKAAHVYPLAVLNAQPPTGPELKAFNIASPDDWYAVQLADFRLKDEPGWIAAQEHELLVFACDSGNGVAAIGRTEVRVSRWVGSIGAALALGIIMYLACAVATYGFRKQMARHQDVQPPLRWQQIQPYSFWRCLDPVVISADMFDRGSLPKLQVLVFTIVIVVLLAAVAMSTGMLQDISPTFALLLGLPALGALGSQVAGAARDRLSVSNWSWLVTRGVLPINDGGTDQPRWRDLFVSSDEIDLYKVQAAAFSVVVLYAMLRAGVGNLARFAVPDSIISILGLSQVVLVGGRFAKPASIGELDQLVTDLRKRQNDLRVAVSSGIDVDSDGKPAGGRPALAGPYTDLDAAAAAGLVNAVGRYRDAAAQVQAVLQGLTHRDVEAHKLLEPEILGGMGEKAVNLAAAAQRPDPMIALADAATTTAASAAVAQALADQARAAHDAAVAVVAAQASPAPAAPVPPAKP